MTRFAVLLAAITVCCLALPAFADEAPVVPLQPVPPQPSLQVRHSVAADKVRVVVDLPEEAVISDQSTPNAAVVVLSTPLAAALPEVAINDPLVPKAAITPNADGKAVLTIPLEKARKCCVFTLPAKEGKPYRVVVDILKTYTNKSVKPITPAIIYTSLERQTDAQYQAVHIVEINTRDPRVHLRVTPAQGASGERLSSMVSRTGAACGVNGGFFFKDARPVGLLKSAGQVISLPLWKRSVAAFPATGLPVFQNPEGAWKVTLPDGTSRVMADWMNASILTPAPSARVIPGATIAQAPANPAGVTAIIRGGKVAALPSVATPLAPGDFALHLIGDEAQTLGPQLTLDAAVAITAEMTPDLGEYPDAVGAGPRLLLDGKLAITGKEEHMQNDILVGRRGRTAIGTTPAGRVVLVVVEEPCPYGGGATLEELAGLLKSRGVTNAINFDGGGSSQLAVGPEIVTAPPKSWVRPVASGVLVFDDRLSPTVQSRK